MKIRLTDESLLGLFEVGYEWYSEDNGLTWQRVDSGFHRRQNQATGSYLVITDIDRNEGCITANVMR